MIVQFIQFPFVITDNKEKSIFLSECVMQPKVGDRLEFSEELQLYQVFKSSGEGCANGACGLDKIGD